MTGPKKRLTEETIARIVKRLKDPDVGQADIARSFGIDYMTVKKIALKHGIARPRPRGKFVRI